MTASLPLPAPLWSAARCAIHSKETVGRKLRPKNWSPSRSQRSHLVPNAAAGTIPEQVVVVVVFRKERSDDHALIFGGYFCPVDGDPRFAFELEAIRLREGLQPLSGVHVKQVVFPCELDLIEVLIE